MKLLVDVTSNTWLKSSYSGSEVNCVEVARHPERVAVRDSKSPHATHLEFDRATWASFLAQAKSEVLD